jgi:acyl CoA:acetate/3-ketoacid CoA transferase beta subunit
MPELTYTAEEMMTIAAARELRNGTVCFVGIGVPSTAANLARRTHAPNCVLVYESGCIGAKPSRLPSPSATANSPKRPTPSSRSPRSSTTGSRAER